MMKVSLLQENFAKGLNVASRSIASRAQLPILSHVLLTTDKGRLKIAATNLETGVNLWLGAKIEKEGEITIPAKILTEFVSSLPADKVDLEVKDNSLSLVCGSFRANFNGLPANEFPLVPTLSSSEEPILSFNGEALAKAANQVSFAAAVDEGRPVLTGVLLTLGNDNLVMAATDGYRLSVKKINTKSKESVKKDNQGLEIFQEFKYGLIIPARTLTEMARVVNDSDEKELKIAVTPKASQIIFALPEIEIVSRLIEGEFPDYQKIMPEKGSTEIVLEQEELIRAVRMAAIFARDSANIVKFEIQGNKLKVSANTAQVGSNLSEIEIRTKGKNDKIAFNSRYLLDFLGSIHNDQIILEMGGALNPGVFRLVDDTSYVHIIMPVRVQE